MRQPHLRLALLVAFALALPVSARAQGGFLNRIKEEAAKRAAKEAAAKLAEQKTDSAAAKKSDTAAAKPAVQPTATPTAQPNTPAATPTATTPEAAPSPRPGGSRINRRNKPLDPTTLESPDSPQGGTESPGQPAWHGTAMSLDQFKSTIPEITEDRLHRYIRARTALTEEAIRLSALYKEGTRPAMDTLRKFMWAPLAADEQIPLPGYVKVWPMAGPRRLERYLDNVMQTSLGEGMTRMQFYQLHEMIEMFLDGGVNSPISSSGMQGRKLTPAELKVLEKYRRALVNLREKKSKIV